MNQNKSTYDSPIQNKQTGLINTTTTNTQPYLISSLFFPALPATTTRVSVYVYLFVSSTVATAQYGFLSLYSSQQPHDYTC